MMGREEGNRQAWPGCAPGGGFLRGRCTHAGDPGLIPGSGRSPGEGNGNPLQYACLGNPMDGRGWLVTVHGVTKIRRIRLSDFSFSFRASLVAQTVKKGRKKVKLLSRVQRLSFDPWVRKIPSRREWQATPVLPGKFHEQRSLVQSMGSQSWAQ